MVRIHRVIPVALLLLAVGIAPAGCGKGGGEEGKQTSRIEGGGEVLATYGDKTLTLEEFEMEADKLPPQVKPMLTSPERRKQYVENLIISKLLIADARKKGLDKDEEVRQQVEETENRLILQKIYQDLQNSVSVTDAEVEAYYKEHPDEYSTTEVRASHILVEDKATAEDLLKQLKENPDDFAKLAKEHSKDTATAAKGGDLGFFGRGRMVPDFEKAVFALKKPGELSEIVQSPFGYHIILLTEKNQGEVKPLNQVKEQIRLQLLQARQRKIMEDYVEKLKAENQVQINDEVLAKYASPPPAAAPPAPVEIQPDAAGAGQAEGEAAGEAGKE